VESSIGAWGDVPTWVLAVTAFLALVASVAAARIFNRQLKLQQEQLRMQREQLKAMDEERERSQAAKVSAWIDSWDYSGKEPVVVKIRNGSEEPVWQVAAIVYEHWGIRAEPQFQRVEVVPPGETVRVEVRAKLAGITPGTVYATVAPPLHLQFEDVNERLWRRTERGTLVLFPLGQDKPPLPVDWATPILQEWYKPWDGAGASSSDG
jgi:hypothetical protein